MHIYIYIWHIPLKWLHSQNPSNLETQIRRYKFNLTKISLWICTGPKNRVPWFVGFRGCSIFSWNCHTHIGWGGRTRRREQFIVVYCRYSPVLVHTHTYAHTHKTRGGKLVHLRLFCRIYTKYWVLCGILT